MQKLQLLSGANFDISIKIELQLHPIKNKLLQIYQIWWSMLQIVPFDYQKYYYMQTILWYLDIRVEWHVIFNPIQQKSMEKSNQTFQTKIA